jgi:spermidine/putrescine-binding protein
MNAKKIIIVGLLFIFFGATFVFAGGEKGVNTVRVLGWSGYFDKDWVIDFEKENNITFEIK